MEELDVPVSSDADEVAVTDGGDSSTSTLGTLREGAEEHYTPLGLLDRLPGRLVFTAGALTGSLLTIAITFLFVRFY